MEPVTEFDASGVVIGGTTGATTATAFGSGTTYTVTVTGVRQPGTLTLGVLAGAGSDAAGNTSAAPDGGEGVSVRFATATGLVDSQADPVVDEPVTLMATVHAAASASAVPTGSVLFTISGPGGPIQPCASASRWAGR